MIGRLLRFGAVGVAASLTHWGTAVALVRMAGADPQLANVGGFLVAFVVSFLGQWRWTFGDQQARVGRALPAFFVVALAGFCANALAYRALLTFTGLRYDVALAVVLVAVAGGTFVLSRYWAFRGGGGGAPPG